MDNFDPHKAHLTCKFCGRRIDLYSGVVNCTYQPADAWVKLGELVGRADVRFLALAASEANRFFDADLTVICRSPQCQDRQFTIKGNEIAFTS
jgi:hypothetical protein